MEKKLNIAEILKDCPKGVELDCTMYEDVYFDYVDELNIIHCYIQRETHKTSITFNQNGTFYSDIKSKCVIFPKSKTTWEGFQRPFEDGDVLTTGKGSIFIYKGEMYYNKLLADFYCGCTMPDGAFIPKLFKDEHFGDVSKYRFATEEEKQKLFDAIKANGYKWNADTKTLEKLKVNKFDITTLKPFESRVLVRDYNTHIWEPAFWGKLLDEKNPNLRYLTTNGCFKYCIPYENNQHLLGTTNDCDKYFKTWE